MVKTIVDWTDPRRVEAIGHAAARLLRTMAESPGRACVWSLSDVIWPRLRRSVIVDSWLDDVTLVLEPLSRIGQMEGKSGSLVLVGRFSSGVEECSSHPMIVKTRLKAGTGAGLADEWARAQAVKPLTYDRKDSFAIPVAFDEEDAEYEVLWSLCMPVVRETEAPRADLGSLPGVADPTQSARLRAAAG